MKVQAVIESGSTQLLVIGETDADKRLLAALPDRNVTVEKQRDYTHMRADPFALRVSLDDHEPPPKAASDEAIKLAAAEARIEAALALLDEYAQDGAPFPTYGRMRAALEG